MNSADYRKLFKPKEHSIQTEIMNWLRQRGWYVMRINSGKYSVGEGTSKRFIMGAEAGTPDLLAFKRSYGVSCSSLSCKGSAFLFIEVKREGKSPTPLQIAKMTELELFGARCLVAHSIEELQSLL